MKKIFIAGLAIFGSLGMVGTTVAGTVTLDYQTGTLVPALKITEFSPDGASMIGMTVTAFFAGGDSETLAWASLGMTLGGVESANGWSLSESGNTYFNPWTLASTGAEIQKIVLDGLPGNTVFDIKYKANAVAKLGLSGTTGSVVGWDFQVLPASSNNYSGDITATYSNMVYLPIEKYPIHLGKPVGDVFRTLTIDFGTNSFGSSDTITKLTFRADTDKMIAPVPEPAALLLFATGLAGLAALGRRRRN